MVAVFVVYENIFAMKVSRFMVYSEMYTAHAYLVHCFCQDIKKILAGTLYYFHPCYMYVPILY